jgi:hypothetical protein
MRASYLRTIVSGLLVWALVFSTFAVFDLSGMDMPLQGILILLLMPLYAFTGAWFLYRKGARLPGWVAGVLATCTALVMDALVTVPLLEIPRGGSYALFFTNGLLWALAGMNLTTVWVYWRWRIFPVTATRSAKAFS